MFFDSTRDFSRHISLRSHNANSKAKTNVYAVDFINEEDKMFSIVEKVLAIKSEREVLGLIVIP